MNLSDPTVTRLAAQLVDARRSGTPLATASAAGIPTNDSDAYRVQSAVTATLGKTIPAWKVGAASPSAEPNGAPIFECFRAHESIHAGRSTGVELEIAYSLAHAFPAGAAKPSRSDVEAAVDHACIVLETCQSRIAEGMEAPALLRLADNGINHGLVIGPRIDDWRRIDLKSLVARVEADGKVIADTTAGHTAPDLIGLLTWLVGHAVTERGGLAAGTIVTTGSWMGIRFVTPPTRVRGTFVGVGSIDVQLA